MITAADLRLFALSLPEAEERSHWGKASFRVRNKLFAVIQEDEVSVIVKTTDDDRMAYTAMDPAIFSIPASHSSLNYMLVQMNLIDPEEMHGLLLQAWRLVAPKRLIEQLRLK